MTRITAIDAHTAGEPLRLITGGFPVPEGHTMLERREWLRANHDHLRRAIMLEPRGHTDMYGALLTPPEHPGSHAGVLFMHNEGYSTMCGHGTIAVVTIALERRLIEPSGTGEHPVITLDAPCGPIRTEATFDGTRVHSVRFRNVPSFVLHGGVPVKVGGREVRVDVAFGGAFYAIVDSEAVGIPVVPSRLPDLRRVGMEIKHAVEKAVTVAHPLESGLNGIYGTIFTGPPSAPGADLRNVTIFADAEVDRSPCGSGTAAVMAVLAEMGVLGPELTFTHESIIGTIFKGRIVGEARLATPGSDDASELNAIVPEIEGEAYITGENVFLVDERDPLAFGFRL